MEYSDMLEYIHQERKNLDDAVNDILLKYGGVTLRPDAPAAEPEKLKKQGCIFGND